MNERPERIHAHDFHAGSEVAESRTRLVLLFTIVTMVVEIIGGLAWNSMALLADGFHMASHAFALGLSAAAYFASRRLASDRSFAFGTWKIEVLAGYTSALMLLGVSVLMVTGAVERLIEPKAIDYPEATAVAILGLIVNVVSIVLLGHFPGAKTAHEHACHAGGHHDHVGHQDHSGHLHKDDLNLRAAYIHVLTDLLTSVLALIALGGGALWGLSWLDPVTGIVGAVLVAIWAKGLLVESSKVLLDREMDDPIVASLQDRLEQKTQSWPGVRLLDVHLWRIGRDRFSAAIAVEAPSFELGPEDVHERLRELPKIAHATVEVRQMPSNNGVS